MTDHPWFGILFTIIAWTLGNLVRQKARTSLLDPVLLAVALIIGVLLLFDIPYEHYNRGGRLFTFLLGPAVVALAVPLYRQLPQIRRDLPAVIGSVFVGSVVGIVSASGLVYLLGGSWESVLSVAPKSVTTPIAMDLAMVIGGTPPITIAAVVLTGILGGMMGPEVIGVIGKYSDFAQGIAIGTASHGIGTARALGDGELKGAMSSVGMTLNGIFTAIILPLLAWLLFA